MHKTNLDDEQYQRILGIVFGRVKAVNNTSLAWSASGRRHGFHRRGHDDKLSGKRIVFRLFFLNQGGTSEIYKLVDCLSRHCLLVSKRV